MADYSYDESGNMAAYFLLTFLLVVLIPFTLSSTTSFRQTQRKDGCPCQECVAHRAKLQPRLFNPKTKRRSLILLAGWSLFGFLVYRVATSKVENKIYNPFEILGIGTGLTVKEIKSHYKQLSKKFHPDKVKLAVNETMEAVEARFVEITKAYKSLTDDTIRENWERYGHPDGRQEISMGIALPKTIIEGRNRNLTLAAYGLIFGGMLPAIVGRWWFGNREKTKDGVNARSAATFFKSLNEESGIDDVVASLGKSFEYERQQATTNETELAQLEKQIEERLGSKWDSLKRLAEAQPKFVARRRAFILLHAHLLRLPIQSSSLRKEQTEVLLQTPTLLNSLLNIVMTRNWLVPAIAAMRLHAYLTQALLPGDDTLRFAQLPGIAEAEAKELSSEVSDVSQIPEALADKEDGRTGEIKKALSRWGKLDIVDASFKVIGERVVTPLSIVFLVVKLRITPPTGQTLVKDNKEEIAVNGQRDKAEEEFLNSRKEVDDMPEGTTDPGWAHAPHWPANRKPGWWLVLADPKIGRIIVPPMKISDVPLANPNSSRDYRSYKVQFQAPPNVMAFAWKVYLVSDTYVGEEVSRDVRLSIEEARDEEVVEDDISDPEEDSLAGQMAMMRGGSVKKRGDDESDEESSTDDDEKSDDDSSSSDSD